MHACYRTIIAILLMLALQLVALSSRAFAQRPLAVPGAEHHCLGINGRSTIIVGAYIDTSGRDHGFCGWERHHPLDVPGAVDTEAPGINAAGTSVVGLYETPAARPTAFCGRPASPSSGRAEHPSLRDQCGRHHHRGQIRGHQRHGPRLCVAGGQLHRPRRPGARGTRAFRDQCGWHHRRGHVHGQQRHGARLCVAGGSFTALFDFPGARGTRALGINAAGTIIVGWYRDTSGTDHGFLWRGALHPSASQARGAPSLGDQCGWHHHRGHVRGQQHDAWFCHTLMKGEFGHIFNQNRACDFCKPMILLALHTKHAQAPYGRTQKGDCLGPSPQPLSGLTV